MSVPSFVAFSIFTITMVALLIGLGNWQIAQRDRKHALIAKVERRASIHPVKLEDVLERLMNDGDIEYMRVRVRGVFKHEKERHYFATFEGKKGWHIYTPLELSHGRIVMVNRGFVPSGLKMPRARILGQISGETVVTGLARKPGVKGYFSPENDIAGNRWFWRDLSNMFASVYEKPHTTAIPFFIDAEDQKLSGGWPKGGVTRIVFRDNHLQYAITWYGLAIVLIAVYGFFFRNWISQRRAS